MLSAFRFFAILDHRYQSSTSTTDSDETYPGYFYFSPRLRDPADVLSDLELAGAEYIEGLINPMENIDYYAHDKAHAAIALGIAITDIAYKKANFQEMIANWTPQTQPEGEFIGRIGEKVIELRDVMVRTDF